MKWPIYWHSILVLSLDFIASDQWHLSSSFKNLSLVPLFDNNVNFSNIMLEKFEISSPLAEFDVCCISYHYVYRTLYKKAIQSFIKRLFCFC